MVYLARNNILGYFLKDMAINNKINVLEAGEYITSHQASDLLDLTTGNVTKMINRGKFPGAIKVGRDWLIPVLAVQAYYKK